MTGRRRSQCDFKTIHAEYSWIAAWRTARGGYAGSWQKTEFHKAMADLCREFQTVEHAVLPMGEIQDGGVEWGVPPLSLLETQLHNTLRIGHQNAAVKDRNERTKLLHLI